MPGPFCCQRLTHISCWPLLFHRQSETWILLLSVNMPTVRLQTIVVQNDLSVNSKLSSFAEDSCHQPFGAEWFVFPETAAPTPTAWLSGSLVFENWETKFRQFADFVEFGYRGLFAMG